MVFGGVFDERLQLNEDTLWSGGPKDWNNPRARDLLPEVRAADLCRGVCRGGLEFASKMQGPFNQSYLPLGDLRLHFAGAGEAEDYHRELDLDNAVATTRFSIGRGDFHPRGALPARRTRRSSSTWLRPARQDQPGGHA